MSVEGNLADLYACLGNMKYDFRNINLYELIASNVTGGKVVDIGCGSGNLLNIISKKAEIALGIEPNQKIIDLNLNSTIMSCRTFTPQFKKQGYGKIINVSSACDRRSWPGWSVYSAAKAAVNSFTRCLYTELRTHGICVMLLVPGGSNTGFEKAAENVTKFEWDEELAVRPEHFADMVYQACALTKGGCVTEMVIYGLAQDVSGY